MYESGVGAGPAVFLGNHHPEDPHLREPREDLARERAVLLPLGDAGRDLRLGELANGVADAALVFGRLEVHCARGGVGAPPPLDRRPAASACPAATPAAAAEPAARSGRTRLSRAAGAAGPGPAPVADAGGRAGTAAAVAAARDAVRRDVPARPFSWGRPGAPPRSGGRPGAPPRPAAAAPPRGPRLRRVRPAFLEMAKRHDDLRPTRALAKERRRSSRAEAAEGSDAIAGMRSASKSIIRVQPTLLRRPSGGLEDHDEEVPLVVEDVLAIGEIRQRLEAERLQELQVLLAAFEGLFHRDHAVPEHARLRHQPLIRSRGPRP